MAELALDDKERNTLASHLDRVCMAKLMRCEAPPDARDDGQVPQRVHAR